MKKTKIQDKLVLFKKTENFKALFFFSILCLIVSSCKVEESNNVMGLEISNVKYFFERKLPIRDYIEKNDFKSFVSRDTLSSYYIESFDSEFPHDTISFKNNIISNLRTFTDYNVPISEKVELNKIYFEYINEDLRDSTYIYNSLIFMFFDGKAFKISFQYLGNDIKEIEYHKTRMRKIYYRKNP